eukprot:4784725-Alexandrium_andersonii.AAC.1
MSASLVGSEMCIRDRYPSCAARPALLACPASLACLAIPACQAGPACPKTVSYTHLTLPTICSV